MSIKPNHKSSAADWQKKLGDLRHWMEEEKVNGFFLPVTDEYQNEYFPDCARRVEWLTGFSGSAGMVAVLTDKAAVFVDGRYTLQARTQVDTELYEQHNIADMSPERWVAENLKQGKTLAYDPWLHTYDAIERMEKQFERQHIALQPLDYNPIDELWVDRPASPHVAVQIHALEYAGEAASDKRLRIALQLREKKVDAAILSAPDSVMWLLNIRGGDVPMTPFALCYALIDSAGGVQLYIDEGKISASVREYLGADVEIRSYEEMIDDMEMLGEGRRAVLYDSAATPVWFAQALTRAGANIVFGRDPCTLPKACKNKIEIQGMRNAHARDGLAETRFLYWLDHTLASRDVDELEAAEQLEKFRSAHTLFRGLSFHTIAGAGPHGAIVHYRSTPESNRKLDRNSLFLLDSGAQYPDGTTDITRTIAIGTPDEEMKDHFTRVLKGHIALATAIFPAGTTGVQLDSFARRPLWESGLDYDHGTGHGVGSYLSVHEGPQRISKRGSEVPLQVGMVLSNEPGYYREGKYGIRIENLVTVIEQTEKTKSGKPLLGFETLTLVPIDTRCVIPALLTQQEKHWLNAYHAKVYETHHSQLNAAEVSWLKQACREI